MEIIARNEAAAEDGTVSIDAEYWLAASILLLMNLLQLQSHLRGRARSPHPSLQQKKCTLEMASMEDNTH